MKFSLSGITSFSRSPLTLATACLSLLWGCHQLPGSRSCQTPNEVVFYQDATTTGQQSPAPSYEESSSTQLNNSAPEVPSPPAEERAPKPRVVSPSLPPLPDAPDMTVPSKKSAAEKSAAEKPTEPKPAEPEKPVPAKKKPATPKIKKSKKPANAVDEDQGSEAVDYFAPDEESETDSAGLSETSDSATAIVGPQRLTQTILEVPPTQESHDSAPLPRETLSATDVSRSVSDHQPMLLVPQPPELTLPKLPATETTIDSAPYRSTNSTQGISEKKPESPVHDAVLTLDAYCDHLVFDRQGFGYVTHRKKIMRFSPKGETATWTTLTNPQGHQVESDGTHLVCDVDRRAVLRLSFDGKIIGTAAKECDGTPLRAPYDLALDGRGGIYFTDPGFLQMESSVGKVHYVDRTGRVSLVAAQLGYPTGINYDSARNRLLVVESMTARILELQLGEPGRIESTRIFAELPKTKNVDCHVASLCQTPDGTLFVTQPQARTVQVFNTIGRPIGHLTTGELSPNRVALRSLEATEVFISGESNIGPRHGKVIRIALGE